MSGNGSPVRGMQFTCRRKWEDMAPIEGGRFCQSCEKPVIDFRGWSREQVIAYFKKAPGACGQFDRHQVDPSLIPIEDVGRHARRGFFAVIAAFALSNAQAQSAPDPPPVEQLTPTHPRQVPVHKPHYNGAQPNPKLQEPVCPPDKLDPKPYRRRSQVYLSGRFPFIHVGRRLRGRMGCPAF